MQTHVQPTTQQSTNARNSNLRLHIETHMNKQAHAQTDDCAHHKYIYICISMYQYIYIYAHGYKYSPAIAREPTCTAHEKTHVRPHLASDSRSGIGQCHV